GTRVRGRGADVGAGGGFWGRERRDLRLRQEPPRHFEALPALVGGHFHRLSWLGRVHGLAVWSQHRFPAPRALSLPASRLPGRLPRRRAPIPPMGGITLPHAPLSHRPLLHPPPPAPPPPPPPPP